MKQNDQNNQNNFMDPKTIIAIILVVAVWLGWQNYLEKKYPKSETNPVSEKVLEEKKSPVADLKTGGGAAEGAGSPALKGKIEEKIPFNNDLFSSEMSSSGLSLKRVSLKRFTERNGEPVEFSGGESGLFSTSFGGIPVDFSVSTVDQKEVVGVAEVGGVKLKKIISFDSNNYSVDIQLFIEGASSHAISIGMSSEEQLREFVKGSLFAPATENQEAYVIFGDEKTERPILSGDKFKDGKWDLGKLVGLSSHYFTTAMLDYSDIAPEAVITKDDSKKLIVSKFVYNLKPGSTTNSFHLKGYFGPKELRTLEHADDKFAGLVNYGFFGVLAKPMHLMMRQFYSLVGNWGLAIILLTLLVRLVVLPFNLMSFKSMKAMQKVQPLLQQVREKYKDDPTALNRETMEIMKTYKVNPLGGCLPMLLQIPVFLALYQVFGQSIDLYQSPFIFWIKDLSLSDPYYVLPVLMGLVMFINQKLTPSTMDPAQAKIMMIMPVFFSFLMIKLPSALTLYIFVSTLFGIIQQMIFKI